MPKPQTAESIAEGLSATERVLLFCIGTGTDWRKVVTVGTAQHMIRGLIERAGGDFALTDAKESLVPGLLLSGDTVVSRTSLLRPTIPPGPYRNPSGFSC
jgi:hypothetical protein